MCCFRGVSFFFDMVFMGGGVDMVFMGGGVEM
jgi:hypothetical protein